MFRKKRARKGDGETAEMVLKILTDAGLEPEALSSNQGYWAQADVFRWEVIITNPSHGNFRESCGSWQTMKDFVKLAKKYGFHVTRDGEIWANEEEN